MSHHFSEIPEIPSSFNELFRREKEKPGATGRFPRGKLSEQDEGEIRIAIKADPRTATVFLNFGEPVASIGFSAFQAGELAGFLIEKANEIRGIE